MAQLTAGQLDSILQTLPIGFYAGRRVPVKMDNKAESSYYNPMVDEIAISVNIINKGLEKLTDPTDDVLESAVRAMLYHELSHALLTPKFDGYYKWTEWLNIFEDERIETVCDGYYMDVNFKQNLYNICGNPETMKKPSNPDEEFYLTVRYRMGKVKYVNQVGDIIRDYAKLNSASQCWSGKPDPSDYWYTVKRLYDMIRQDWRDDPANGHNDTEQQTNEWDENGNPVSGTAQDVQQGNGEQGNNEQQGQSGSPANATANDATASKNSAISAQELKDMMESITYGRGSLGDNLKMESAKAEKDLQLIFASFNKKNSGGSGVTTYSGVFNPRNIARSDYRFFDRSLPVNGTNKYGTCHLNLFLDCSGSYHRNVPITNALLATLSKLERNNKNFTMDVVFCGDGQRLVTDKRDRVMTADAGNWLTNEIKDTFRKLQKPNTCVYNIVLFDGDCSPADGEKTFSIFDTNSTTLILDDSNKKYTKNFSKAKIIYSHDYANELIKNVVHVVTKAFS